MRQRLYPCATRVFEKLRWDAIAARRFVIFEASQAVAYFVERELLPQPVDIVPRVCQLSL